MTDKSHADTLLREVVPVLEAIQRTIQPRYVKGFTPADGMSDDGPLIERIRHYLASPSPPPSAGVDAVARNEALKTYTVAIRDGATPRSAMDMALREYFRRSALTSAPTPVWEGSLAQRNLQDGWSAMRMIREAVETLGPIGALPAEEHLAGPTFLHEAEAIVAGIMKMQIVNPTPVKAPMLCDDEGCPHHGTPHVCFSRPADGSVREALEWVERQTRAAKQAMKESAALGNGYANFAAHDAHKHLKIIAAAMSAPASSSLTKAATAGEAVREALEKADADFEAIRVILVKELDEPVRQAFWRAVAGRDAVRAALAPAAQAGIPECPATELGIITPCPGVAAQAGTVAQEGGR